MTVYTARREKLSDCLEEVKPILVEHWEELARNKDQVKLAPKYAKYLAMEEAGLFRAYVVRTDTGEVAGYAAFIVAEHLHYEGHIWALSDLFFVRPQFRMNRSLMRALLAAGQRPKGAGR